MGMFDRLPTEPVYNTRAVVQRTGVPADTFRAWERRYGVPMPTRTAGNQRLFSDRDIATITWLRDQTRAGLTISQAVALLRSRSRSSALDDQAAERNANRPERASRLSGLRDDIVRSLVGFDAGRADRAVEEAMALLSTEDVCLQILQPALYEIGHRWARGEVDVSVEHFASGFVIRKIGALFNLSQPEVGRGPLVSACLEGELHEIGLLLTSLFLSRRGYRIVYLGANLPLDDLLRAISRVRPLVVLLSASTPESAERLAGGVERVLSHCAESDLTPPARCPTIGIGGHVFVASPEWRERVPGVFLGRNADEAVEAVERIVSGHAQPP